MTCICNIQSRLYGKPLALLNRYSFTSKIHYIRHYIVKANVLRFEYSRSYCNCNHAVHPNSQPNIIPIPPSLDSPPETRQITHLIQCILPLQYPQQVNFVKNQVKETTLNQFKLTYLNLFISIRHKHLRDLRDFL